MVTPAPGGEAFDEALAQGSEQLKLGQLDLAQRSFRAALDADPGNARVLALLGLTYFRGNQFGEARPIYEQLVEATPTDASHRLNLGLVYLKLNESDLAITSLEASRALDPSQGRAVSYLGLAYARAGRYAQAYRSFLLAGQNELASEIEINLTITERDGIHQQLGRAIADTAVAVARTSSSPRSPRAVAGDATNQAFEAQLSQPEIKIERLTADAASVPMRPARSGASVVEAPAASGDARNTDSMQFVLPTADPPAPISGVSMISHAVAAAAPATAASAPERTRAGGIPPRPLSELATDALLRPDDGEEPFEVSDAGVLTIRVTDRVMTRLDGIHISGGDLSYDHATRRSRGHQTEERFDFGGEPLHTVSGSGYLIAIPGKRAFTAVVLDDDILYLREDLVFAFETSLRWESGNVPGMRGKLPVVQFRGDGALVIRVARPLVRVKLPASGVVFVDAERLAGWIGRVIPRAVVPPAGGPMGMMCIECTGEGVVLVEPEPEPVALPLAVVDPVPPVVRAKPPTPPPAVTADAVAEVAPELDPDLDMSSVNELLDPPGTTPAEPGPAPEDVLDALSKVDEPDRPDEP